MRSSSDSSPEVLSGVRRVRLFNGWDELARVREIAARYFCNCSEDLREAAMMTVLELSENVVKHGVPPEGGVVTMSSAQDVVLVSSQNRLLAPRSADVVAHLIRRIAEKGPRMLYVARMVEVMESPETAASGLGLLRIAYEGGFELSSELLGDRLHINAKRRIDRALPI